jgi:uncharacterized membrane protein YfcA
VHALFSLAPEVIPPVALSLNVVVAGRASYRFAKAGFIDWRVVVPIVVASMPLAFIGGGTVLPPEPYRPLLGSLLILSAVYLAWQTTKASNAFSNVDLNIPRFGGFASGGAIGFASGLSGIGGGVLLSPFFLIFGWTGARKAASSPRLSNDVRVTSCSPK